MRRMCFVLLKITWLESTEICIIGINWNLKLKTWGYDKAISVMLDESFIIHLLSSYGILIFLHLFLLHEWSYNHRKKCWNDLMVFIEFGSFFSLFNFDRSYVVSFLVAPPNIVWWGVGRDMGWKGVRATCTLLFEKHCLKLAIYVRKT